MSSTMMPMPSRILVMSANVVLEARLDMLSLAIECVGASLSAAQAREVASAFSDRRALLLTQCGQISDDVEAAPASQAGLMMQAFRR
jgi:hypothetical protein